MNGTCAPDFRTFAHRPAIRAGAFDAIDAIVMAARFGDAGASQQGKRERGRAEEAGHGWLRILWGFGCGARRRWARLSLRAKRSNLASLAHARAAEIASSHAGRACPTCA